MDYDPGPGYAILNSSGFVTRLSGDSDFLLGFISAYGLSSGAKNATIDAKGNTFLTGGFTGTVDFDPSSTTNNLVSAGGQDLFFVKIGQQFRVDATHPHTFNDANGDLVTVKLSGPGFASYTLSSAVGNLADLAELDLSGTDLSSALTVTVQKANQGDGNTTAANLITVDSLEHVGSITLGSGVILGNGTGLLKVTGKINTLTLDNIFPGTLISLGQDLPYNIPTDTTTPDTYNNHPTLTIGNVLGFGVVVSVLGDGSPQGVGGGGLGNITIGSWIFPGSIKTTQSIGNLNVLAGDFLGTLEIDSLGNGSLTTANTGNMNVLAGNWGSSGNIIEGSIASFTVGGFLAGAEITAASVGKVTVNANSAGGTGSFDGTLVLTDPAAATTTLGTFLVGDNFSGTVITSNPIKNLLIKGIFKGTLQAASIGTITALSFDGTTTNDTLYGDATRLNIIATEGAIGSIKALTGSIKNYDIVAPFGFGGFTVALTKLTSDTTAIENVHVQALSIGAINVSLKAAKSAPGIHLTGISNSQFTTTGTGVTTATAGNMGNVTVAITGGTGQASSVGIENTSIDAQVAVNEFGTNPASTLNAAGKISVKLTKPGDLGMGLENFSVTGDTIGAIASSITGSASLNQGAAITGSSFTAGLGGIGNIAAIVTSSSANLDASIGLDAIRDSSFGSGAKIGTITATAKISNSATADNAGLLASLHASSANVTFTAPSGIGAVTASAAGAPDDNVAARSEGAFRVSLSSVNGSIGASHFTANKGAALNSQAHALTGVDMTAAGNVGAIKIDGKATVTQVSDLQVRAGGTLSGLSVSATTKSFGSLINSNLLAGQSLIIDGTTLSQQTAQFKLGSLGAVSVSGSLSNSKLVAGGSIGALTVGADMTDSLVLAGAKLGGDFSLNGNETYFRQGSIASVTVQGRFQSSSIVAGVTPGLDTVFGNDDDAAAANAGLLTAVGGIKSLVFGAATTSAALPLQSPATIPHNFAVEAGTLGSMKIGSFAANKDFTQPLFIDATDDTEDAGDIIVRLRG